MPKGIVRFFEGREGGVFVGDAPLKDTSVGTPVELDIGTAIDVAVSMTGSGEDQEPGLLSLLTRRVYLPIEMHITNAKALPVSVEIRQGKMQPSEIWSVTGASRAPKRKSGDYVWRFTVPANGAQALSYKIATRIEDY